MIVIDALGVSVTSLLAAFSVVGLAASLAVQDSLSNLASGIMLMVSKPFKLGDYVDIDDVGGTVKMIGLIHTRITTVDNKMIYVPNSKIISTKIINYTTQDKRRVDLKSQLTTRRLLWCARRFWNLSRQSVNFRRARPAVCRGFFV